MLNRLAGKNGRRLRRELLLQQKMLLGNVSAVEELVDRVKLKEFGKGDIALRQGSFDNSIHFILSGDFDIVVNDTVCARRCSGEHIGEMATVSPSQPRAASAVARLESVTASVSADIFAEVADRNPFMYKSIAVELARRLHQRNQYVPVRRKVPRVFVCSSSESLELAKEVSDFLATESIHVDIWKDTVSTPGRHWLACLMEVLGRSDFGIVIASADDLVDSRGLVSLSPRDNVVFEHGLFAGRLGLERSVLMVPEGVVIRLPSDLDGLNTVYYGVGRLSEACERIRIHIERIGTVNESWSTGNFS